MDSECESVGSVFTPKQSPEILQDDENRRPPNYRALRTQSHKFARELGLDLEREEFPTIDIVKKTLLLIGSEKIVDETAAHELGSLFSGAQVKQRQRSDSAVSDGAESSKNKKDSRELLFGAHERPGATQRRRTSIELKVDPNIFPPLPAQWIKKHQPLQVNIIEPSEEKTKKPSNIVSPLRISIPSDTNSVMSGSPHKIPQSPSSRPGSPLPREPAIPPDDLHVDLSKFSFWSYLYSEVFGVGEPGHLEPDAIHNIHNFLNVPFKLESLIQFGVLICLDSFLFVLTFLPIRVFFSIIALLNELRIYADNRFKHTPIIHTFHRTHLYDMMRGCLIIFGFYVLNLLNMSRVYHFIRGQNVLKLYVLTGMLEIFDKLLCTFGQDAFDALYWQTCVRPEVWRISFAYAVVFVYVVAHSCIYFCHVATLTVAFNSDEQALITVLILNNFSEIKAFVFKKLDKQQLFQLACSDITERFILCLFWFLVLTVASAQAGESYYKILPNALQVVSLMVCGEAIADSIKHAFISKFNNINASTYHDYGRLLRKDVISASKNRLNLDHTYAISRRVGLSQIPLACVTLRYLSLAMSAPVPAAYLANISAIDKLKLVALVFSSLLVLKICVGIGLLMFSVVSNNNEESSGDASKKKIERNLWMDRLEGIERFTLWKGKIVA